MPAICYRTAPAHTGVQTHQSIIAPYFKLNNVYLSFYTHRASFNKPIVQPAACQNDKHDHGDVGQVHGIPCHVLQI
jgi:hypothetical protein